MRRGGTESGVAEDGLEQLAHSLIGNSVSFLPQDQDFKGAEGFEVRLPLFGTADGYFVIDGDRMSAASRWGEIDECGLTKERRYLIARSMQRQ